MKVVIGSRGSALALWQANWAKRKLASAYPDLSIEIEVIKTEGDRLSETLCLKLVAKRYGQRRLNTRCCRAGLIWQFTV